MPTAAPAAAPARTDDALTQPDAPTGSPARADARLDAMPGRASPTPSEESVEGDGEVGEIRDRSLARRLIGIRVLAYCTNDGRNLPAYGTVVGISHRSARPGSK